MKRSAVYGFLALVVLCVAAPMSAMCLKCDYGTATCWGSTYASAARCYSYGSSCMTAGTCSSDDECVPGSGCGPDVAAVKPLNLDYTLVAVKVQRPAKAQAVLAQKVGSQRAQ
jgi:hypothetical protein